MTSYLPKSYSGYVLPWDRGHYFSSQFGFSSAGIRSGFFNVNNVIIKDRSLWADEMIAYRSIPPMQMYFDADIDTRAMQVDKGISLKGETVKNEFKAAGIGVPETGKNPKPYVIKYGYLRNFYYYGNKGDGDFNRTMNIYAMSIAQAIPKYFDRVFYNAIFRDNTVKKDGDTTTGPGGSAVSYVKDCATTLEWGVTLKIPSSADEAISMRQEILGEFYRFTDAINKDENGIAINQGIQRTFVVPKPIVRKFRQICNSIPHFVPYKNSPELSQFPWHDEDSIFRLSDDVLIVGLEKEDMPIAQDQSSADCRVALFTYPDTFQIGIQDLGADELFYNTGMSPEQAVAFLGMINGAKNSNSPYSAFTDQNISLDNISVEDYEGKNWGEIASFGFKKLQGIFGGKALMFPSSILDMLFEGRPLSDDVDHSKEGVISAQYNVSAIRIKPKQMVPVLFKETDLVTYSLNNTPDPVVTPTTRTKK